MNDNICVHLCSSVVPIKSCSYELLSVQDIDALLESLPPDADLPYWAILWESAIALSEWLMEHPEQVCGKQVLELGAGLGLCSLVAMELGALITQSDYEPTALSLAARNARLNGLEPPPQFLADWRQWNHSTQYEVILGSDVVYNPHLHQPVLHILQSNLKPQGVVLLADPWRDAGWKFADLLITQGWQLELHSKQVKWEGKQKEVLIMEGRLIRDLGGEWVGS